MDNTAVVKRSVPTEPRPAAVVPTSARSRRRRGGATWAAGPYALLLVLTLVPALAMVFVYAFWRASFVAVEADWNLENFAETFTSMPFWAATAKSLFLAIVVVAIVVAISVPYAFYVAYGIRSETVRTLVLLATIIPFLVGPVVRVMAWFGVLGKSGLINYSLDRILGLGPVDALLFGWFAVVLALVYNTIQLCFFPIYVSVQSMDQETVRAAQDLGAGPVRTFVSVVLPMISPGVLVGACLVYVMCLGAVIEPVILGGPDGSNGIVSAQIYNTFLTGLNWPLGAAQAVTATVVGFAVMTLLVLFAARSLRTFRR